MPWAKVSEKWPDFKLGGFREGVDKATDPREVCMMGGGVLTEHPVMLEAAVKCGVVN